MIIKAKAGDIFETNAKHIAFAINTEGVNDAGFAGAISRIGWPQLSKLGDGTSQKFELGTILSKKIGNKTFHGLVCHSLNYGWGNNQADIIKHCFDQIPANNEPIASIAIGTGIIGISQGADFKQIIVGMNDSTQQIELHSKYTIQEISDIIKTENEKAAILAIEGQLRKKK